MTARSIPLRVWPLAILLLLTLALTACQEQVAEPTAVADGSSKASQASLAEVAPATPVVASEPTATSTPTPSPMPTPTPTATATNTPTPTPAPRALQLTTGGCCTQPFWSPDSQQIRFIDKPAADVPVGIWGVAITEPLAEPVLVSERIEESLTEGDYLVDSRGNTTVIERLADGERWTVPAGGRSVQFSPDQSRIAWSVSNNDVPVENRVTTVWVANLDGSEARAVATLPRGGLSGWISGDALLLSSRENLQSQETVLSALSLMDGTQTELARGDRLRSAVLSPSGHWLVYYNTFGPDPSQNGLWLISSDGSQRIQLDRELFGAYQWRGCREACSPDEERLLIVPFRPETTFHSLWEVDPATGEAQQIIDPAITPFKIANGDWRVSPDGSAVVYVESSDRNIWVIQLPE